MACGSGNPLRPGRMRVFDELFMGCLAIFFLVLRKPLNRHWMANCWISYLETAENQCKTGGRGRPLIYSTCSSLLMSGRRTAVCWYFYVCYNFKNIAAKYRNISYSKAFPLCTHLRKSEIKLIKKMYPSDHEKLKM